MTERFWTKAKQYRWVATRYDKTARNFLAFVHVAAIMVLRCLVLSTGPRQPSRFVDRNIDHSSGSSGTSPDRHTTHRHHFPLPAGTNQ